MRWFISMLLFFGGASLAAAPALAGHLDRRPVDWGCWLASFSGLLLMVYAVVIACRRE